ncbi:MULTISPECIES: SRPBCC family protein [unclassified Microbacterium]|uniref:SRPBCC family protein n=1 Tax=unclassified Microbacterium TaxID=2609290 RepID=UPI0008FCC3E6|nr:MULTISPECIES: SRPBCC family protein [unclassified Microbacterium]OIU88278.1 polyketide cyclase [Microbacterium sp. AR7-10]
MARNVRVLHCAPEDVFEVLSDGWLYPTWVVGASRMRAVDPTWPMRGSRLHHSFGVWPMLINDETIVEEHDPPRSMVMRARGWPMGEARVTIEVRPRGDDCFVRIQEEPIAGPGRFVPRPIMNALVRWRNAETLHRLAYLSEGRAAVRSRRDSPSPSPSPSASPGRASDAEAQRS